MHLYLYVIHNKNLLSFKSLEAKINFKTFRICNDFIVKNSFTSTALLRLKNSITPDSCQALTTNLLAQSSIRKFDSFPRSL